MNETVRHVLGPPQQAYHSRSVEGPGPPDPGQPAAGPPAPASFFSSSGSSGCMGCHPQFYQWMDHSVEACCLPVMRPAHSSSCAG